VEQDPIGDGINWYVYVDGNPITGIDPEGLQGIGDVDWGEAFDLADWSSHARAFWKCLADEVVLNDFRSLWGGVKWVGRSVGPKVAQSTARKAGGMALRRGSRARRIATDYANMRRAQGQMAFAGNRVTKGWHRRGSKWMGRFWRFRGLGKWAKWGGRASGWYTAGQVTWAYGKCLGS